MPVRNGGWCWKIKVGLSRRFTQRCVEPGHVLGHQVAAVLAWDGGVEADQPHRPPFVNQIEPGRRWHWGGSEPERGHEASSIVVIARYWQHRHAEAAQYLGEHRVLGFEAIVDEVAGCEDNVGQRGEAVDVLHCGAQHGRGVDPVVQQLAGLDDVTVGDLCNQH